MKYVGKKLLTSKRKLPPLKGKKRRRTVIKETDWMKYYGSSEEVKLMVEEKGADNFHREILTLCKSKGELGYLEAKYQFENDVLLRDDFYNGIIQCKIHNSDIYVAVQTGGGNLYITKESTITRSPKQRKSKRISNKSPKRSRSNTNKIQHGGIGENIRDSITAAPLPKYMEYRTRLESYGSIASFPESFTI